MTDFHALTTKAMVVNLSIGIWQGQRLDRDATRKVTDDAGAAQDAARVNKHLLPKAALAAIVTASGAVRNHLYSKSLPWRDNGDRLVTRKLYTQFIEAHEGLVAIFNDAVSQFINVDYPSAIAQAEFRMGGMFNRDDYPESYQLRRKFYVNLDIDALATSDDFRVQIDQEHVDKVRASMAANADARLQTAMGDVWKRMAAAVGAFHERMANPDAVFRDSTVGNVADLLDLIPGLNVLDDPDIEAVREAISSALGGITAKEIRKDPELRAELATEADAIMDKMHGFMRAFGAGNA